MSNGKRQKFDPRVLAKDTGKIMDALKFLLLYTACIMSIYPDLFPFKLCDYDTRKGIDFVVEKNGSPKYIELKGTLGKSINHPFRHIYKFICYDLNLVENDIVTDLEEFKTNLKINKNDQFYSFNGSYKGQKYKSYKLEPASAAIESMEIIVLKEIIETILGGKFI